VYSTIKKFSSTLFDKVVTIRTLAYEAKLRPVHRVPGVKVVSVGNLRVGGSGKTPFCIYLAKKISARNIQAAILFRGYRGTLESRGGLVSSATGPEASGDEAYQAAKRLQGVPIWVGKDRVAIAKNARDSGAKIILLDDGFQHRRLHRDLDILLVSPEDMDDNTALLPAGPLRERAVAAKRAHLLGGLSDDWRGVPNSPPLLIEYQPVSLISSKYEEYRTEILKNDPVFLLSGIARPERFYRTASQIKVKISGSACFPDHHPYTKADLRVIVQDAQKSGAKAILTTEKDLARLHLHRVKFPLYALRVEIAYNRGEHLLLKQLESLISLIE
jgi:tetraacyldisaccharide 4'-kinase